MARAAGTMRKTMLAGAAALALLPAAALAQAGPPEADRPAPQTQQAGGVDGDIVVTAQRREERLQGVPAAITATSEKELVQLGAKSFTDIARTVPGLVFTPGALGTGGSPIIRGISSQVGAATVGFYIDDTPLQIRPQPFSGNPDPKLFDIDRIEVLRGPQGTLFGASSMGGTIRLITPSPWSDRLTGRARAEIAGVDGGDPNYEFGLAGGGKVADTFAVRASAFYRRDGGYIDRVSRVNGAVTDKNINGSDTLALRFGAEWRPVDGLSIRPAIFYQRIKRDDIGLYEPARPGLTQSLITPQRGEDEFYLPSLTVGADVGSAELTSVTSYFKRTDAQILDYSPFLPNTVAQRDFVPGFENYIATSDNAIKQRVWTQEVRITSNASGPFRYIFGGFYRDSRERFDQFVADQSIDPLLRAILPPPARPLGFLALGAGPQLPGAGIFQGVTIATEKQFAVFGEGTYAITPQLEVTAGLRVSRVELDFSRDTSGPLAGGALSTRGTQVDRPVTPKATVTYKPSDDNLLYATAQRGFRVGGVNPPVPATRCADDIRALGGNPPPNGFKSDSLWSYEIGTKNQFFDRRVTLNLAAYIIDWKDIQQLLQLPTCGFGYTDNLGTARSKGVEFELSAKPVDGLTLAVKGAYTDAKFSQDVLSAPNPTTGVRAVIARNGDRVPGVPDWTLALSADYRREVASGVHGYVRGDFQYVGESFRTLPQGRAGYVAQVYQAESYEYVSARAGVTFGEGWDISAFATNLTNGRPLIGASTNLSPRALTVRGTTLAPRTIGLTVARNF